MSFPCRTIWNRWPLYLHAQRPRSGICVELCSVRFLLYRFWCGQLVSTWGGHFRGCHFTDSWMVESPNSALKDGITGAKSEVHCTNSQKLPWRPCFMLWNGDEDTGVCFLYLCWKIECELTSTHFVSVWLGFQSHHPCHPLPRPSNT